MKIASLPLLIALAAGALLMGQAGRARRGGAKQTTGQGQVASPEMLLASFSGTIHDIDAKTLTLNQSDSNTVEFLCSRKTKYYDGSKVIKFSLLKPGDKVSVEARQGLDGALEAVNVRLERPKS